MSKDVKEALEVKVPAYAKQTEEFNETQAEFDRLKKQVTGEYICSLSISYLWEQVTSLLVVVVVQNCDMGGLGWWYWW